MEQEMPSSDSMKHDVPPAGPAPETFTDSMASTAAIQRSARQGFRELLAAAERVNRHYQGGLSRQH